MIPWIRQMQRTGEMSVDVCGLYTSTGVKVQTKLLPWLGEKIPEKLAFSVENSTSHETLIYMNGCLAVWPRYFKGLRVT